MKPKPKKIKVGEDSKNYVTKIKTDDKGDITSMKTRRTVKGFLSGAPTAKKAEASATKSDYKRGGRVKSKKK
jgi:hypothetical protein